MSASTVIIPAFNCASTTRQCLDLLVDQVEGPIVVVDDASTDDTQEVLRRHGKRVQTVTHSSNQGFAVSCNDGARCASGDLLVFLNNDTLPQPGWLEALVQYAERHPEAAIIGARLLYPDQTVQHAGVVICEDRYPRHLYAGFPGDHPAVRRNRPFQIVTAACMLVRRNVFEACGGFDTRYRNGFEDVDLCLRVGQMGGQVHYCGDSTVIHLESASPGRFDWDSQNVSLYRENWFERVVPDEWRYYLDDGLIRITHEGQYPVHLEVSPLLATLADDRRTTEREQLLRKRSRQVAGYLREITRLRLALGGQASVSDEVAYEEMRREIRRMVRATVPSGSTVAVISKGDPFMVEMKGYQGWHFPKDKTGAYAGFYPPDSRAAIAHLQDLTAEGAEYLVIPRTAYWWLDHYRAFAEFLETRCVQKSGPNDPCRIYALSPQTTAVTESKVGAQEKSSHA